LRQIGLAITMYADGNGGSYPRTYHVGNLAAGDPGNTLGNRGADLGIDNRQESIWTVNEANPETSVGRNNIPAALFLLITIQKMPPEIFLCPSTDAQGDTFNGHPGLGRGNFTGDGPEPNGYVSKNLSYGYANPYGSNKVRGFRLSTKLDARFPIMADMGPGLSSGQNPWASRRVMSGRRIMEMMNSLNHDKVGQNVLYADGRVEFRDNPFVGFENDNIYVADTNVGKLNGVLNVDINLRAWTKPVPELEEKAGESSGPNAANQTPLELTDSVILPWAQM
jgi:hypothetical protein